MLLIKEIGLITILMEMVIIFGQMDENMRENGKMDYHTVRAC